MARANAVDQLPKEVRAWLDHSLVEGNFTGYELLEGELKSRGYSIGKSSIHRYGQKIERRGSSPRMRGTQDQPVPWQGPVWFIPADAGTHGHVDVGTVWRRFIPADAGNTAPLSRRAYQRPVHPRGCGEHSPEERARIIASGSSPRMRGTRGFKRNEPLDTRFIPADAGNTPAARQRHTARPVHPRGCGEHANTDPTRRSASGSSPRMRGTPTPRQHLGNHRRFIPADAGNTWLAP